MTEMQYFWGWVVYLAGAIGCLLSLWFIVGQWHPRVKRALMMAFAVLFFLPGRIHPEQGFLGPAFLISLYDGLSQGIDALWRSGQAVAIATGIAAIAGLLLPVNKVKVGTRDPKQKKPQNSKQRSNNAQHQRKEPTC